MKDIKINIKDAELGKFYIDYLSGRMSLIQTKLGIVDTNSGFFLEL